MAVQLGGADPEFHDLPIKVVSHEALPQQLHAVQLRLGAALAVVSAPLSPDRTSILGLSASPDDWQRHRDHIWIKPNFQGAPALQRFVTGRLFPDLVDRRDGAAHSDRLPCCIHEVNPPPPLRDKALQRGRVSGTWGNPRQKYRQKLL